MPKPDSWQVHLLQPCLRLLASAQLVRHDHHPRASVLPGLLRKPMTEQEISSLKKILHARNRLRQSDETIEIDDYGTGAKFQGVKGPALRAISAIHRTSAVPHWWGVFLFKLVRALNPHMVLELGTNLGVSAAYIQAALDLNGTSGRLATIEGDATLASRARETVGLVSDAEVDITVGRFSEMLPSVLERHHPVDLAFLDGHHEYEATLDYFAGIKPFLSPDACVVFDDIYIWSRPVRKAWKKIAGDNRQAVSVDFAKFGVLLMNSSDNSL